MKLKKLVCLLLALLLTLSVAACSDKDTDKDEDDTGKKEESSKDKDPSVSWRDEFERGQELLEDEEYDDAIDALSNAIDAKDDRAEIYIARGQAYQGKGGKSALRKAKSDFESALELDEENEDAWVGLVQVLLDQEEYDDAADKAQEGLDALGSSRQLERLLDKAEDGAGGSDRDDDRDNDRDKDDEDEEPVHVHTWMDANYQEGPRCSECGELKEGGEPLKPDFETYDIYTFSCTRDLGNPYTYQTACYEDPSCSTLGFLTETNYTVVDSDDTHEYGEGYEWRIATFQLQFSDYNANSYGYDPALCQEDYYDIRLNDDSGRETSTGNIHRVNWHGEEYVVAIHEEISNQGWNDDVATVYITISAHVPVGYDGVVFGFFDSSVDYNGYLYQVYDETFLLFRFD